MIPVIPPTISPRERTRTASLVAISKVRERSASGALGGVLQEPPEEITSPRASSPFSVPALLEGDLLAESQSRFSTDLRGRFSTDSTRSSDGGSSSSSHSFLPSSGSSTSSSIASSVSSIGTLSPTPPQSMRAPRTKSPRPLLIGSNRSSGGSSRASGTCLESPEISPSSGVLAEVDSRRLLSKSMVDLHEPSDPRELLHSFAVQARAGAGHHALESVVAFIQPDESHALRPRMPLRTQSTHEGMHMMGGEWVSRSQGSLTDWKEVLREYKEERKTQQQPEMDLTASRKLIAQVKRKNDLTREVLEQRRHVMRGLAGRAEAKVRELRERETQFRAQLKETVDRYTSWHALQLRQTYRTSAILQLLHLSLNRVIMERKASLLTTRIEELLRHINLLKSTEPRVVPPELQEDPTALFNKPEINRPVARIHRLSAAVVQLHPEVVRLKNLANTDAVSRINRAKQLLEATPLVDGLNYHEFHPQRQRQFDAILLDQRAKEGKSVARLRRALIEKAADVTPADVVEFLEAFVAQITKDWELTAALAPRMRLYVLRSIYPLIWPDCAAMLAQDATTTAADAVHVTQLASLQNMTPVQMHLDPLYFTEGDPFSEAINTLNSLPYDVVPLDLLYVLRRTMQQTCDCLKRLQSVVKGFAADDILPAFIWVVCRSDVASPHLHALFMDMFTSANDKMGEFGYCLTSYHAALMHLTTCNCT